jgi:hypothetical protein
MPGFPLRDDRGTTRPAVDVGGSACPVCGARFAPVGRQAYCSSVCRKRAFRARRGLTAAPVVPTGAPAGSAPSTNARTAGSARPGCTGAPTAYGPPGSPDWAGNARTAASRSPWRLWA